jgi:hypothetical protein
VPSEQERRTAAIIRSEFGEVPGLRLTIAQASRLWNLDCEQCTQILDALVAERFLNRTEGGVYGRWSHDQLDGRRSRGE